MIVRSLLAPFGLVYAAGLRVKNFRYDKSSPKRLNAPVISVGNLSVGGSGKTPLVIRLAELLTGAGFHPDVLSRGYGRESKVTERVDPAGDARRFGDEPLMIARANVPVFLGASRYHAGLLAEREIPARAGRVHLLDDGFQHRQLARAIDVVFLHRNDLNGQLLPAGRLREPLASLRRADIVVLREEDSGLADEIARYLGGDAAIWLVKRRVVLPPIGNPAIAFCAIARPREFFADLEASGAKLEAKLSFRDHHKFSPREVEQLCKLCARHGCGGFITTEKDAVRLDPHLREQLTAAAPLRIASLRIEFSDEAAVLREIANKLKQTSA